MGITVWDSASTRWGDRTRLLGSLSSAGVLRDFELRVRAAFGRIKTVLISVEPISIEALVHAAQPRADHRAQAGLSTFAMVFDLAPFLDLLLRYDDRTIVDVNDTG